jgi:uncharacterized protein
MKLHLSSPPGLYLVTACGEGFVRVGDRQLTASLILLPEALLPEWPVDSFDTLSGQHLGVLLEYRPELVLLGTGRRHRTPHPALHADLIAAGIGLEAMSTAAACRTYNILAAEGRRVAAALIVDT